MSEKKFIYIIITPKIPYDIFLYKRRDFKVRIYAPLTGNRAHDPSAGRRTNHQAKLARVIFCLFFTANGLHLVNGYLLLHSALFQ